jgi:hypothetical protein
MATGPARVPPAPSAAEAVETRQITRWGDSSATATPESPVVQVAPSSFTFPRLLPTQATVEASTRPRELLISLQSWEGVVLEVDETSFVVRLIDVGGEHADEEVTLSQDELSEFDLELLEPGAILYWTIGYLQRVRGARERVSRIRLRRLPAWTEGQLKEARESAAALAHDLDW